MMNNRIKELADQAELTIRTGRGNTYMSHPEFNKKFAELIVAECVEVCRQGKYDRKDDLDTIQFDNGIRFCMNAIDEHFGD